MEKTTNSSNNEILDSGVSHAPGVGNEDKIININLLDKLSQILGDEGRPDKLLWVVIRNSRQDVEGGIDPLNEIKHATSVFGFIDKIISTDKCQGVAPGNPMLISGGFERLENFDSQFVYLIDQDSTHGWNKTAGMVGDVVRNLDIDQIGIRIAKELSADNESIIEMMATVFKSAENLTDVFFAYDDFNKEQLINMALKIKNRCVEGKIKVELYH